MSGDQMEPWDQECLIATDDNSELWITDDREQYTRLMGEYRQTGCICGWCFEYGETDHEDKGDPSTWGPRVEELDWTGFPYQTVAEAEAELNRQADDAEDRIRAELSGNCF